MNQEHALSYVSSNNTESSIEITLQLDGQVDPADEVKYIILYGPTINTVNYEGHTQTFTFDGLEPDTPYTFHFEVEKNGESIASLYEITMVTAGGQQAPAYFEDAGLERAVRNSLGIEDDSYQLVDSDIERLVELEGSTYGDSSFEITSLKGLEIAKNLKTITMYNNNISDLSPISTLTQLENLYLGNNNISDLSPIQNLINLKQLTIGANPISDVTVLKNFPNLDTLDLSETNVDISVVTLLPKLDYLNLDSANITSKDLVAVSSLKNLLYLHLNDNDLTDVSALSKLVNLKQLLLEDNHVTNLAPLSGLKSLEFLMLNNNGISNLLPLSNLVNLRQLFLGNNNLSDLTTLSYLDNVELLNLNTNGFSKIDNLLDMDSLQMVILSDNSLYTSAENVIHALEEKSIYVSVNQGDVGKAGAEPAPIIAKPVVENGVAAINQSMIEDAVKGAPVKIDVSQAEEVKVTLPVEIVNSLKESGAPITLTSSKVALHIPTNNLPADKEISADVQKLEPVENAVSDVYDFTIFADGERVSQFEEPITLTFNVDVEKVKNPADLQVYYFNGVSREWELIPGAVYEDGKVLVTTDHFSIYSVFEVAGSAEEVTDVIAAEEPVIETTDEITEGSSEEPVGETDEEATTPEVEETNQEENSNVVENNQQAVETGKTSEEATNNEDKTTMIENTEKNTVVDKDEVEGGEKLPVTASSLFNTLLLGSVILLAGVTILFVYRKRLQ